MPILDETDPRKKWIGNDLSSKIINWLSVYRGFVGFLIRIKSEKYSDAKIRYQWERLQPHGIPSINGPELGEG